MKSLEMECMKIPEGSTDWIKNSSLCKQWEMMKQEIDRYKWLESEKAGYDIGWDRAWTQWTRMHGAEFKLSQRQATGNGVK